MLEPSVLKGTYLCAGLTDEQVAQVAALAELHAYQAGHELCRIGQPAADLYVVISGHFAVTTHDGDKLGEIGPGSLIGEIAIVDVRQRTANVTSIGAAAVASIKVDAIRKLMTENREWGFLILANIARLLAVRLRQADARIDELCDKSQDSWNLAMG